MVLSKIACTRVVAVSKNEGILNDLLLGCCVNRGGVEVERCMRLR